MEDDATTHAETPRAANRKAGAVDPPSRYRLMEVIGEGGMGRVYRAHDTTLGRDVAIKIIETELPAGPDKTQQRERFVREARAAARLVHPNIVAVHDVDPEAGWLVMDLVEGKSLRELAGTGPLPAPLVRTIAAQVLSALAAAHASGVIHRDIKPSNIIIGAGDKITLVDFGVARLMDVELTKTGDSLGTPAYMAPEQIRGGTVDARTDLYALGATLYELVTGTRMIAFESPGAEAMAQIDKACRGDRGLAQVIVRCLQGDPLARFDSAQQATIALSRRQRPKVSRAALAAVAVFALGGGGFAAWRTYRAPGDPRYAQAFTLAQRGEHDRAGELLAAYLVDHPGDADALAMKFLADWWSGGVVTDQSKRAIDAHLDPSQRAMVLGIDLITQRRETEAIAYLESAEREHPAGVETLYALGEAQWHGQELEQGAATLERAFLLDPRWEMALHHVVEFRLSRGEATRLVPIADKLRAVDPETAAALDCKILVGQRKYAEAASSALAAMTALPPSPEIDICLAQAQALAGDLDAGMATAKKAFELWPIDLREWGGFAQYAEFFLYRGQLAEYLALVRGKPSRQSVIAQALWKPQPELHETAPSGPGMRMPPLGAAVFVLVGWTQDRDEIAVYGDYPEPEVKAFGIGLWAEKRGDLVKAIASYRRALEVPQKGDMRMLVAHALARTLRASGDDKGAAAACEEVVSPREYQTYRAVLLPDCLVWTGQPKRLLAAWTGSFELPAVAAARAAH